MKDKKYSMNQYKQEATKVKCPICYNEDAHILWSVNSKQAAQHFVLQERNPKRYTKLETHIRNLWNKGTCDVVRCDKCEFVFSNPYVSGNESFYRLAYDRSGYPEWKWEYQQTYDILVRMTQPDIRLLEVGAGEGAFIKKITEKLIPKKNILCTEYSTYGKGEIEKYGVKCLSEDIRQVSNECSEGEFDIICMFQVLEHMDKLDELFKRLADLVKEGGSLFIAVPNSKNIEFNELNGALLDMPPNHIGRWNKECFKKIGERNGFKVKEYKQEKSSFKLIAKQFLIYRFMRKAQENNTIANRICRIKKDKLFRVMRLMGVVFYSASAIPEIISILSRLEDLGDSQWVHYIKVENSSASGA